MSSNVLDFTSRLRERNLRNAVPPHRPLSEIELRAERKRRAAVERLFQDMNLWRHTCPSIPDATQPRSLLVSCGQPCPFCRATEPTPPEAA